MQGLTVFGFRKLRFLFVCDLCPENRDQRAENWELSAVTCGLRADTSELSVNLPSLGSHRCFNYSEGYLSTMHRAEFQVIRGFRT